MKVSNYLAYTLECEKELSKTFQAVSKTHSDDAGIHFMTKKLAQWCDQHASELQSLLDRLGEEEDQEPDRVLRPLLKMRSGSLGLLRDLHDLWLMSSEIKLCWTILIQCAKALRDKEFHRLCVLCGSETKRQSEWCLSMIKQATSQILTVPA